MTKITIPPEALEAGARKMQNLLFCNSTDGEQIARAALLAMIEAWEGAKTVRDDGRRQTYAIPAIILPLTEKTDDKA